MRFPAKLALVLALAGTLASTGARADPGWGAWRPAPRAGLELFAQARPRMSREEREQLREQLRSADRNLYRNPQRGEPWRERRFERQREPGAPPPRERLTPEQREQLREDILNAYRRRGRN